MVSASARHVLAFSSVGPMKPCGHTLGDLFDEFEFKAQRAGDGSRVGEFDILALLYVANRSLIGNPGCFGQCIPGSPHPSRASRILAGMPGGAGTRPAPGFGGLSSIAAVRSAAWRP